MADDFVEQLFQLRLNENNPHMKKTYKLTMNSLYGCFGTILENSHTIGNVESLRYITKRFVAVYINAAISGCTRIHMYELITKNNLELLY